MKHSNILMKRTFIHKDVIDKKTCKDIVKYFENIAKSIILIDIPHQEGAITKEEFSKAKSLLLKTNNKEPKEIKKIDSLNEIEKIMSYQNNFIFKNY